ncbi:SHOCT-like domain-containing protein [Caldicoprobacter faecalis]|uniref:YvlB/LiaX N-terminal domain-containing protein n=1 Tax=Caldicoprobacter faecalis TaxID=937334 RepID=A0A1I5SHG9_9FIRM|nr:hypothetical protein [Caldicoprobacter faecalis]PZN08848.1 MAG: hypothetical protein DIU64_09815 [Caldicoprobacter oshimai]SFP70149.1 hypothetical protein SAMN05444406_102138 [Caldicoprobacter faecalis]
MKEEIRKILKMVEEKKITAEEAEKLIDLVEPENTGLMQYDSSANGNNEKFLRIKVVENGANKVNVNIPLSLLEVGLKLGTQVGAQFEPKLEALKNIDFNEIVQSIKNGAQGKLVEVRR